MGVAAGRGPPGFAAARGWYHQCGKRGSREERVRKERRMEGNLVVRNWVSMLLKGLLGLLFGLLLVVWPDITLKTVIKLFGVFALVFGAVWGVNFLRDIMEGRRWGWSLALTLIGVFIGLMALARTYKTGMLAALLLALWLMVSGVGEVAASSLFPPGFRFRWLLALDGSLSILAGFLLMLYTEPTAFVFAVVVGIYFIVAGIMDIFISLQARRFFRDGDVGLLVVED
jgi:uncharacterized membrane protein HdeD (DUF308 family)